MRRSERDRIASEKARSTGFSAVGPSLLESLERCLLDAMDEWLALKEDFNENHPKRRMKRGEVRGLARAIAKIRLPYEDQHIITKQIEKEFLRKVKNNG
jgi:hypothetical protein